MADHTMTDHHDAPAERALLGAMLHVGGTNNPRAKVIAATVQPASFYLESHRAIARAWLQCGCGDVVQCVSELRELGLLNTAGGAAYLAQLAASVPSSANWEHYHDTVAAHAARRDLRASLVGALAKLDKLADVAEVADAVSGALTRAATQRSGDVTIPFREAVAGALDIYERALKSRQDGTHAGWTWGDQMLDRMCPVRGGDLVVLGARKKSGKTALSLQGAMATSGAGHGVLYITLEMTRESIGARGLGMQAGVPDANILDGDLDGNQIQRVLGWVDEACKLDLWVSNPGKTFGAVEREIRAQLAVRPSIRFVVVDYLQLMSYGRRAEDEDPTGSMAKALAALAKETGVGIVLLSQLNRDSERDEREPQATDLRRSGQIEEALDRLILLWRPEAKAGRADVTLAKIGAERYERPGSLKRVSLTIQRGLFAATDETR